MVCIVLKVSSGNHHFDPFCDLENEDDLAKSWKIVTKVHLKISSFIYAYGPRRKIL